MNGIVKMMSGLGAAVGAYRAVILCMVLAAAWGLHAGWVGTLLTGGDPYHDPRLHWILWAARWGVLWAVLVAALWQTAPTCADRVSMTVYMLVFSGLVCLAACMIVMVITDGIAAWAPSMHAS